MTKYPNPISCDLLSLPESIYNAKVLLPDFQRGFDWDNKGIIDLIVSLLNGYFIGTFLVQKRGSGFDFAIRYFEGLSNVNGALPANPNDPSVEANVDQVVLDGQQRLTALFYSLYHPSGIKPKNASYPHRYFIRFCTALDENLLDENVVWSVSEGDSKKSIDLEIDKSGSKKYSFRDLIDWAGCFSKLLEKTQFKNYCYEQEIIPCSYLKDDETLDSWLRDYSRYHIRKYKNSNEAWDRYSDREAKVKSLFDDWLKFRVPIVPLENRPLAEVAEIFERINRTGTELSVFSLASAVFFKHGCNLREWWQNYFQDSSKVTDYCEDSKQEDYPKCILQIIALRSGKEVRKAVLISPKELLNSSSEQVGIQTLLPIGNLDQPNESLFLDKWQSACKLLDRSLERIEDTTTGYGVIKPEFLPYKTIIVTLSALLELCSTSEHYRKLDIWYWSSLFTERYGGASDTAIKQDYDQVKRWLQNSSEIPEVVREAPDRIDRLDLKSLHSKGALYKSIVNIIALKGSKDFFTGQALRLENLEDHHIFPKKCGVQMRNENSILNRTLISKDTNLRISKTRPSGYLQVMIKELAGEEQARKVLETHLINHAAFECMQSDDYEGFIAAREEAIKKEMMIRVNL